MKYLMMVVVDGDPDTSDAPETGIDDWFAQVDGRGQWVMGERLRPPSTAKLVRVRDGERIVTDGPFAETKEWLAGFDILDCATLDDAVEAAAAHPMARGGRIELREFWPFEGDDDA
ncbi:YciI family protein [Allobranchiibius sp. GilTou38]|uniref:YciI family protein n=1 Tax=Allobranchiibius sp. GilTou38 TaxID=2815210 RepID=UPI001AA0E29C|nr:YciI family protein [Allobranchiibius sp. GilTou38]MBO1768069.1 hypothetical protein [Allobranchiibius sp. GilTou38]